jgi:hypothetical protein
MTETQCNENVQRMNAFAATCEGSTAHTLNDPDFSALTAFFTGTTRGARRAARVRYMLNASLWYEWQGGREWVCAICMGGDVCEHSMLVTIASTSRHPMPCAANAQLK